MRGSAGRGPSCRACPGSAGAAAAVADRARRCVDHRLHDDSIELLAHRVLGCLGPVQRRHRHRVPPEIERCHDDRPRALDCRSCAERWISAERGYEYPHDCSGCARRRRLYSEGRRGSVDHATPATSLRARAWLASFPAARGAPDRSRRDGVARPAPAEWAPVEIVCHLRDEEAEDFGARLRVVLEGGTSFVPIDPERWAVERRYLEDDGPRALAAFLERRKAGLGSLAAIVPARLTGGVEHSRFGRLLRARYPRRLGRARSPSPDTARRHTRTKLGDALCASAHGVRRPDPLRELLTSSFDEGTGAPLNPSRTRRADSPASRCPRPPAAARSPA